MNSLPARTRPAFAQWLGTTNDVTRTFLAAAFQWEVPSGGMFVWAVARDPKLDTDVLLKRAMESGVCITPSSVFDATGENRRAIRVNFTRNEPDKLREGVKRLAVAVKAMQTGRN